MHRGPRCGIFSLARLHGGEPDREHDKEQEWKSLAGCLMGKTGKHRESRVECDQPRTFQLAPQSSNSDVKGGITEKAVREQASFMAPGRIAAFV